MKSIFPYILLLIVLGNSPGLREILKVPTLGIHYYEHLDEQEDLSFLEYLDLHYGDDVVIDDDFERDMKLPFKLQQTATVAMFLVEPPILHLARPITDLIWSPQKFNKAQADILDSQYLLGIFHPPKLA